jgi:serine/threonine-protein kinase
VQIGPYTTLCELGRGGQGVVFRCRAPDGRDVAVKVLHRATPGGLARFERERRLLASLGEDAGFVPVLDTGETPGAPFFVMPFLEGGTLRARLKKGRLGVDETIALGARLASALGLAHGQGIVHRDLKPENVLFSREGVAFVSDLGLAKHFLPNDESVPLSQTGDFRGSPGYMAPEQAHDAKRAGPEADVFAIGAILYECLTGEPPFRANSVLALLAKMESETPRDVRQFRRETPDWLAGAVLKALAREPEDRFPDGAALAQALAPKARERSSAGLAAIVAAGLIALGTALGFGIATFRGATKPEATPSSPRPSDRPSRAELDPAALLAGSALVTSRELPMKAILAAPDALRRELVSGVLKRAIVYSVADARALESKDPGLAETSSVLGIALIAQGNADDRPKGKELILRSASHFYILSRTAEAIDRVDAALGRFAVKEVVRRPGNQDARGRTAPRGELAPLREILHDLPRDLALAVLEPLLGPATAPAGRADAVEKDPQGKSQFIQYHFDAIEELDDDHFVEGHTWDLADLSPRFALRLRVHRASKGKEAERMFPDITSLARKVAPEDPELACFALDKALYACMESAYPGDRASFDLDMATLTRIAAQASPDRNPTPREVARVTALYTLGWCTSEVIRGPRPPPRELVIEGLAAARHIRNGNRFTRFALETGIALGDADREFMKPWLTPAQSAEVDRLRGEPRTKCLEWFRNRDPSTWGPVDYAVLAMIEADAGNFPLARELLQHTDNSPIVQRFHRGAVSRYIEEKERR